MEVELKVIRIEVSRETGEVKLLIETDLGFKPVLGWPNRKVMKDFARTLLGICMQDDERTIEPDDTNKKRR
jgi:hypothetical protein